MFTLFLLQITEKPVCMPIYSDRNYIIDLQHLPFVFHIGCKSLLLDISKASAMHLRASWIVSQAVHMTSSLTGVRYDFPPSWGFCLMI